VIEPSTKIKRNERAVYRELTDGAGVVLNLDTSNYHGVNATGAVLWELTEPSPTFGELVATAMGRFENAPPELEDDVEEFVLALVERDLLELTQPDGA
jgi:hypothetical protein